MGKNLFITLHDKEHKVRKRNGYGVGLMR